MPQIEVIEIELEDLLCTSGDGEISSVDVSDIEYGGNAW